jgi:hypothetical protein
VLDFFGDRLLPLSQSVGVYPVIGLFLAAACLALYLGIKLKDTGGAVLPIGICVALVAVVFAFGAVPAAQQSCRSMWHQDSVASGTTSSLANWTDFEDFNNAKCQQLVDCGPTSPC